MSFFDRLVAEALGNRRELGALQAVVAKELLHHDILREMAAAGLLKGLTFIGGTCLRACYGSSRLSEDLDFTGGESFCRDDLCALGGVLVRQLEAKYGLAVTVGEPAKEVGDFATWKVKVDTHPQGKSLPSQRINIDICALPSYERRPMMLRNIYGVDMGTAGLILQVQSREEIMVDKIVALALRPNRLKNRDVWDLAWLRQQGVSPAAHLLGRKLGDRQVESQGFVVVLQERLQSLEQDVTVKRGFFEEMRRFLPGDLAAQTLENEDYWTYLCFVVREECEKAMAALAGGR